MTIEKIKKVRFPERPAQLARFGARVRAIRKSRGITQGTLAELIYSATPVISKLERGHTNPTIMTFLRLCEALDVEPKSILDHMVG